jgi:O-antigen ligase
MKGKYFSEYIAKKLLIFSPLTLLFGPLAADLTLIIICLIFLFLKPVSVFSNFKVPIYILLIFFFIIVLSSLINNQKLLFFFKSIAHIRFFIFPFAIVYFLNKNQDYTDLVRIAKFCIIFLVLDSFLQFILGRNILGFPPITHNRMSSIFKDELIMGSYIFRIMSFCLVFYVFLKKKKEPLILLLFSIFGVILSGERASLVLMFIISIIYFLTFIFNRNKKNFSTFFFIFIFFIFTYIFLNTILTSRLKLTKDEILGSDTLKAGVILDHKYMIFDRFIIVSETHHNYFLVGIKMFKDNVLFGHGRGSFKDKSCESEFKINKFSCSTHPHNTYIQLLAETGIFSFLIIFGFFVFITCQILKNIYLLYKKRTKIYLENVFFITPIFISLFPFITTGSFYNNYLNFFYSFSLGIYLMHLKKSRF